MNKVLRRSIPLLLICFVLFLLLFPLSLSVGRKIPAVEIAIDDAGYCRQMEVSVNGVYRWRLIGQDTFSGNISFDAYPETSLEPLTHTETIPALTLDKYGADHLEYGPWMDSRIFGYLTTAPFFRRLAVQVLVPGPDGRGGSWSTVDGRCIVAPASNRQEALEVLSQLESDTLPPYDYWLDK